MLKNSLLWKIYDASSPSIVSYLFGTMHVKDGSAFLHYEKALNHLYNCDVYYGEMDLKASQEMIDVSEYLLPNHNSLIDYIGIKRYAKYKTLLLKTYQINLDNLQYLQPLIIVTKITESVLSEDNLRPLDYVLWQKAESLNMEMKGLEMVEEQISTMRALSIETQLKMLKDALSNINSIRKSTNQLLNYYRQEEIQSLFKATKNSLGSFRKILLYNRNKIMADRIAENIHEASFYAVGAAHLAGNNGILAKLKRKHLAVKAMS